MGEFADPWAGPMLLYGLAWLVLGNYHLTRREDAANVESVSQ